MKRGEFELKLIKLNNTNELKDSPVYFNSSRIAFALVGVSDEERNEHEHEHHSENQDDNNDLTGREGSFPLISSGIYSSSEGSGGVF